ncbi:MAG: PepSY domain-containing protein [Xanthomonadales bacterium]|jgi:uncharacterized iron-regulated membrane protein|nr:PepSY domain-containing protein [Xanthomonadales bacterium]
MRILFRKLHRWLGLLMAVQIVAWMGSGLYFSLIPITEIRGEHLTRSMPPPVKQQIPELAHPDRVRVLLDREFGPDWELLGLELVSVDGAPRWQVEVQTDEKVLLRLVAADGARIQPRLTAEQAKIRAAQWLKTAAVPDSVDWIEDLSQSPEIRGRDLPVWKVTFSQPDRVNLYIHPWTGDLLARRTQQWRIFDFLWMLHIMDFDTRDNFNHPLLQVAAALGLVVALGGVILWAITTRLFRRRRKQTDLVTG